METHKNPISETSKMTNEPIVSIIIPVYKVELYLRQCLDSVINQTYKKIEICIVDDGSPDKCPVICDEYAQKDHRIKVTHKTNGGLSDARNIGIEMATGDYLCFVDSDDIIDRKMIEIIMEPLITDKSLELSTCQSKNFTDGENISNVQTISHHTIVDFLTFLTKDLWVISCGKIYKKELFRHIRFPYGRLHEDEFTTFKLCHLAKRIAYNKTALYFYRQRTGSITSSVNKKRLTDIHDALKEQVNYFKNINEPELYSIFMLTNAVSYSKQLKHRIQCDGSESLFKIWKSELISYSTQQLTFMQKIKYSIAVYMPWLCRQLIKLK